MPDWSRPEFKWDDGNEEHLIMWHDVYPVEIEQEFYNGAHVRRARDTYRTYAVERVRTQRGTR